MNLFKHDKKMPKRAQQGDLQPIMDSILASTVMHNALLSEVFVELEHFPIGKNRGIPESGAR